VGGDDEARVNRAGWCGRAAVRVRLHGSEGRGCPVGVGAGACAGCCTVRIARLCRAVNAITNASFQASPGSGFTLGPAAAAAPAPALPLRAVWLPAYAYAPPLFWGGGCVVRDWAGSGAPWADCPPDPAPASSSSSVDSNPSVSNTPAIARMQVAPWGWANGPPPLVRACVDAVESGRALCAVEQNIWAQNLETLGEIKKTCSRRHFSCWWKGRVNSKEQEVTQRCTTQFLHQGV
jgi:hypothetical protein